MKTIVVALLGLLALPAQAAELRDPVQAEAFFKEGQALMKAGSFDEACDKFTASLALDPAAGTLLNLAACQEKAGRLATAWRLYKQSIELAVQKGNADRERFSRAKVEALLPRLNKVWFLVTRPAPGQELRLDGQLVPWEQWPTPTEIDPGKHTVEVTAPGRVAFSHLLLAGAEKLEETVEVPERAAAEAPPAVEVQAPEEKPAGPMIAIKPAPRPQMASGRIGGIAIGGVGVAALAASAGLLVRAMDLAAERNALCPPGTGYCYSQPAFDKDHEARVLQQWGLVLGGVGLAAAALGAGLAAMSPDTVPEDPQSSGAPGPRASGPEDLSFDVGPTGGGLQVVIGGTW